MAYNRPCPYCKKAHKKESAYKDCKRRHVGAEPWPK